MRCRYIPPRQKWRRRHLARMVRKIAIKPTGGLGGDIDEQSSIDWRR